MDVSPVRLHIYDISRGTAARLSPILLGREVPGLWHTNVVVGDVELSYGPPLRRYPAGRGPLGTPSRVIDMGDTALPLALLDELLTDMARPGGRFSEDAYDILYNNCNTFANEMAGILTGMSVPADVLNQSQEWLSSPLLGQLLMAAQGGDRDTTELGPQAGQPTATHGSAAQPGGSDGAGPSKPAATPTAAPGAGAAGGSTGEQPPAADAAASASETRAAGRVPGAWSGLEELMRDVLRGAVWDEQGDNPWRRAAAVRSMMSLWEEVAERLMGVAAAAAAADGDSGGGDGPVAAPDAGVGAQRSSGAPAPWAEGLGLAEAVQAAAAAAGVAAGGVFGAFGTAAANGGCDAGSGASGAASAPAAAAGCYGRRTAAAAAGAGHGSGCCGRRAAGPSAAAFQPRWGPWAASCQRRCPVFRPAYAAVSPCGFMGPGGANGVNSFGRRWCGDFGSFSGGAGAAGRCCPKACCGGGDGSSPAADSVSRLRALLAGGGIGLPGFDFGLGLGLGLGMGLNQGHCKGILEAVAGLGGAKASAGGCCRCRCSGEAAPWAFASGTAPPPPPPPPFFGPEAFSFFDPVTMYDIFADRVDFAQASKEQPQPQPREQECPAAAAAAAASGPGAPQGRACNPPSFWGCGRRFGRGGAAGCGGGRGCGPRRAAAAAATAAAATAAAAAATEVQGPAHETIPATPPPTTAAAAAAAPTVSQEQQQQPQAQQQQQQQQQVAVEQSSPSAGAPADEVLRHPRETEAAPSSASEGSAGGGWLEVEGLEAAAGEAAGPVAGPQ